MRKRARMMRGRDGEEDGEVETKEEEAEWRGEQGWEDTEMGQSRR